MDSEDTRLLRQIRDLLLLIAEPQIASRDKKLRETLLTIVGGSKKNRAAVLLMEGQLSQAEIGQRAGIDRGQLSRLIAKMRIENLLLNDVENPALTFAFPTALLEEKE